MKLEVGNSYRNRLGEVITIISKNTEFIHGCRGDNEEDYADNGVFNIFDDCKSDFDLIEEVIENVGSSQTISLQEQMDKVLQLEKQLQEAKKQLREML